MSVRISIFPNVHDESGNTVTLRATYRDADKDNASGMTGVISVDETFGRDVKLIDAYKATLQELERAVGRVLVQQEVNYGD